jgi:hypothetical protein
MFARSARASALPTGATAIAVPSTSPICVNPLDSPSGSGLSLWLANQQLLGVQQLMVRALKWIREKSGE